MVSQCVECGKVKKIEIVGTKWCTACVDKEEKRSLKEDSVTDSKIRRVRPPKYMLNSNEYKKYGYK